MRIPPEKIEEVRLANDIVSIVQEYVALKKRGQNYFGLCPFHSENTPSFSVHPGRQIFRCFGCGKGGNVYGFLMELERVTFIEAVKMLAAKASIELPRYEHSQEEGPSQSEQLVQANGVARDFFHSRLLNATDPDAVSARDYLKQRGYAEEAIKSYMLGYAPNRWDGLTNHARESRIPVEIMMQAGLLKRGGETNRVYDAFRDRIMFPIRNLSGRVIAFGGRRLKEPEDDRPSAKYINSPETAVYNKGRELFGLWEARNEIRKQDRAILVEGYTDTLSLISAGINITCASLGTSLTENQARLLKRFTSNVFVLYDGDRAGIAAAKRALDVLHTVGATPRVVPLPEGEDPDSYVMKNGAEALWEQLNNALSPIDFRIQMAKKDGLNQQQIIHELLEAATALRNEIDKQVFTQEISNRFNIPQQTLLNELSSLSRRSPEMIAPTQDSWPTEEYYQFAKLMILRPDVRDAVFTQWVPEEFEDNRLNELFARLYDDWKDNVERLPEDFLDQFDDPVIKTFIAACIDTDSKLGDLSKIEGEMNVALDYVRSFRIERVAAQIREARAKLNANPNELSLVRELQRLQKLQQEYRRGLGSK